MNTSKTINVIAAPDAGEHLEQIRSILDQMVAEERIESYKIVQASSVNDTTFSGLNKDNMVLTLLTTGMEPFKSDIETFLLELKSSKEVIVGQVIVDQEPYEPRFLAFPQTLEPINASSDPNSVWNTIGAKLKSIFPEPKKEDPPVDTPAPWKKYLPYILGLLGVLLAFFVVRAFMKGSDDDGPPPSEDFIVTGVTASLTGPADFEGDCPHQFDFQGVIKANGIGEVAYTWVKDDGTTGPVDTLNFDEAGSKTVETKWSIGAAGDQHEGWQKLKVISPNELESEQAFFKLMCNAEDIPPTPGVEKPKANIRVTSVSPSNNATLAPNEKVTFKYNYTTDAADGVRIFGRPMTGSNVSPNYAAHGSQILPKGSGTGNGYFTLRSVGSNGTKVDRIRFRIYDADQQNLLKESFHRVNYTYVKTPTNRSAVDVTFTNMGGTGNFPSGQFANKGIRRIAAAPKGGYCDDAQLVSLGQRGDTYLSTASPGALNRCNTIPLSFEFTRRMKTVKIQFMGANAAYKLTAYRSNGSVIGERSMNGNMTSKKTITYTSARADIYKVVFGRQAALTKVYRISADN